MARSIGDASRPLNAGYLSTSSQNRYRIGLDARSAGELEPAKYNIEPTNLISFFLLSLFLSLRCLASLGELSSIGLTLRVDIETVSSSLGITMRIGPGS